LVPVDHGATATLQLPRPEKWGYGDSYDSTTVVLKSPVIIMPCGPPELQEEFMLKFDEILHSSRVKAEVLHFPAFIGPVQQSNPLNASPYIAHIQDLRDGILLHNRKELVAKFVTAIGELRDYAVTPIAALVGGSVLGSKPQPKDLDCVIYYTSTKGPTSRDDGLASFLKRWKAEGLDMRAIAADGDPLIFIKTVSFFTSLYSINPGNPASMRGLLLIDCRQPG
jgi:hypothetical protein